VAPRELVNAKLSQLLTASIHRERVLATRDAEILACQKKHQPTLDREDEIIAKLTPEIEQYSRANRGKLGLNGSVSVQLGSGLIGFRVPTNPALVPLSEKWPWAKIERKLRTMFKERFFHPVKPAGLNKNKLKSELKEEQLAVLGMRLDREENFFVELNRLEQADGGAA
jgi:phage host-nuclease inhibitor protein Gam